MQSIDRFFSILAIAIAVVLGSLVTLDVTADSGASKPVNPFPEEDRLRFTSEDLSAELVLPKGSRYRFACEDYGTVAM